MTKQKVSTTYFVNSSEIDENKGVLYLEKRPRGKWLCFKKGEDIRVMKLTKKSFKNLKRLTNGITKESYVDVYIDEESYEQDDEGMCDVFYHKRWEGSCTLPAVVNNKPKEKSPFIVQVFKWSK